MTFWDVLFDPGESTCFASNLFGTAVCRVDVGAHLPGQFFSINPLHSNRKDANVTAYRNILMEFDGMHADDQLSALKTVPYSTLVWSGGKSFHAIISLETPLKTRREYDSLVRRIYRTIPGADPANKNPSRFSRIPGRVRDNGKLQELKDIVCRRSKAEIDAWLGPAPVDSEEPQQRTSLDLSPWTKHFLAFGAEQGGRNLALFKAACDMFRHGYSAEQILERAMKVLDLSEQEMRSCIQSAFSSVNVK